MNFHRPQAAQGIERLFKILIELMYYENTSYDKQKVDEYKNTIESKFPYDEQNINVFSA